MSEFKTFEELEVWKKAHVIVKGIYQMTKNEALSKDFALTNQMRRAAISITSNIAEGHDRKSNKEFTYFLNVAKGSSSELRSQLILAKDLEYITITDYTTTRNYLIEVNKMLSSFIKYLDSKG